MGSHLTIEQLTRVKEEIRLAVVARPLRIERAGGWYHVTARGNERKPIFRDDRDRRRFLEVIAEMVTRFRIRLHCFVLMDNHYHALGVNRTEPEPRRAVVEC